MAEIGSDFWSFKFRRPELCGLVISSAHRCVMTQRVIGYLTLVLATLTTFGTRSICAEERTPKGALKNFQLDGVSFSTRRSKFESNHPLAEQTATSDPRNRQYQFFLSSSNSGARFVQFTFFDQRLAHIGLIYSRSDIEKRFGSIDDFYETLRGWFGTPDKDELNAKGQFVRLQWTFAALKRKVCSIEILDFVTVFVYDTSISKLP